MADPVDLAIGSGGGGTTGSSSIGGLPTVTFDPIAGGTGSDGGLTAEQIREALNQGKITRAEAIRRLKAHGYNAEEAALFLSLDTKPSTSSGGGGGGATGSRLSSTQIREALNQGMITRATALNLLKSKGYSTSEAQTFLALDTTPSGAGSGLTPEQQVDLSIYKSQLRESKLNPWVIVKNNKVSFSTALNPPKGSLGIRRDEFFAAWDDVNELYQAMIGRKAKAKEITNILRKGLSEWSIKVALSKNPAFQNSPIWRAAAPALNGFGRDMFGTDVWNSIDVKERNELIRKAIVEDWSQATVAEKLRQRPEYLRSVEFKTNESSLSSIYQGIFGVPDGSGMATIQEAALARWTPDQFGAWLRQQPGYTSSPEYQTKILTVLDALGAITGSVGPSLTPGSMPGGSPFPQTEAPPPNSPRIPGAPSSPTGPLAGLVPGFA